MLLQPLVDTDLYRMAQKIEDALLQHDTSPCLAWCAENKSKLKKIRVRQPAVSIKCDSYDNDVMFCLLLELLGVSCAGAGFH